MNRNSASTDNIRFRTEIEPVQTGLRISHDQSLMLLGSCFSDNIGQRLQADGFDVCHNPMGPLFNPATLYAFITRLIDNDTDFSEQCMIQDSQELYHAIDFPLRYNAADKEALKQRLTAELSSAVECFNRARTLIVTFGTAWVFRHRGLDRIIGNCHKFPAADFIRSRMTIDEICQMWLPLCNKLSQAGKNLIFTISPIRHLADGLHGNQISKATLQLAVDALDKEYFPAYEIMIDDLRDYRFYADDMKHPSPMAVEYIYNIFKSTYFTPSTLTMAEKLHAEWLRSQHRQI